MVVFVLCLVSSVHGVLFMHVDCRLNLVGGFATCIVWFLWLDVAAIVS